MKNYLLGKLGSSDREEVLADNMDFDAGQHILRLYRKDRLIGIFLMEPGKFVVEEDIEEEEEEQ